MEGYTLKQSGLLASLKKTLKLNCCNPAVTINNDAVLMKLNKEVFITDIVFIPGPIKVALQS